MELARSKGCRASTGLDLLLVVAAMVDGYKLKVPNWLTFPMILAGWAYSGAMDGWTGVGYGLLGTAVGLALLMPLCAIGGMGAGDVKLLAGVGAWVWTTTTFHAFCWSAVIGGVIALVMILYRKSWAKHRANCQMIVNKIVAIRDPRTVSTVGTQLKHCMYPSASAFPLLSATIVDFCPPE